MPPPSAAPRIQDLLSLAETRSRAVSQALLTGEPDQLAVHSADLQQVVQVLSNSLQQAQVRAGLDSRARQRLRRLGQDLVQQREACLRRSAVVDRALQSLMPASQSATYGGGATPYGQQARRTGAFKLFAA